MHVSAGQPFENYCTMTISRVVPMTLFRFVICLRTILCPRLTLSKLQSPHNSLTLRPLLLILMSALFHLCNCSNPSALLRSLNFFQLFHQNLALSIIFLLPSLNRALPYSLISLLTWLICPSVNRALFRPSLSTLLSLHF